MITIANANTFSHVYANNLISYIITAFFTYIKKKLVIAHSLFIHIAVIFFISTLVLTLSALAHRLPVW